MKPWNISTGEKRNAALPRNRRPATVSGRSIGKTAEQVQLISYFLRGIEIKGATGDELSTHSWADEQERYLRRRKHAGPNGLGNHTED